MSFKLDNINIEGDIGKQDILRSLVIGDLAENQKYQLFCFCYSDGCNCHKYTCGCDFDDDDDCSYDDCRCDNYCSSHRCSVLDIG